MDSGVHIVPIAQADIDSLREMMGELADHEGEAERLAVSRERLAQTGFGAAPQWAGFMARAGGEAVGYATYGEHFHLWSGAMRVALDDLYVRPAFRGRGVGEHLMRRVFSHARERGAVVTWTVLPSNKGAIAFYERLGAQYRVIGKCLWRAEA